jgi:hypothetical protein
VEPFPEQREPVLPKILGFAALPRVPFNLEYGPDAGQTRGVERAVVYCDADYEGD